MLVCAFFCLWILTSSNIIKHRLHVCLGLGSSSVSPKLLFLHFQAGKWPPSISATAAPLRCSLSRAGTTSLASSSKRTMPSCCCLRDGLIHNEKLLSQDSALYHLPPRPVLGRTLHTVGVSLLCVVPRPPRPAPLRRNVQVITKIRPMCDWTTVCCTALLAPSLSHFTVR